MPEEQEDYGEMECDRYEVLADDCEYDDMHVFLVPRATHNECQEVQLNDVRRMNEAEDESGGQGTRTHVCFTEGGAGADAVSRRLVALISRCVVVGGPKGGVMGGEILSKGQARASAGLPTTYGNR